MTVALTNVRVACLAPPELSAGPLVVDNDRVIQVGGTVPDHAVIVDCGGMIALPGNVCAHTHVYSSLARGMPAPPRPPRNFREVLELVWWRLDRALDEPSIRYSALIGAIDAIRSGTTTLVDHHASPNYIDGSLDIIADAFEEVGCRGVLCYEVTDRGGKERRDAGLRENERFWHESRRNIAGMVGAHASFTLDDDTLEALAELSTRSGRGVHIHVAEDLCDETDALRRCGKRVAQRLVDAGLMTASSIVAHGVHLDAGEIEAVRERGSWFAHNCRSNLNNSVGRAPVACFGPRTALGTDGIDADMFAESRTAFFRAREDDLTVSAEQFTSMLAAGGGLISEMFDMPGGSLSEGAAADLILLDYRPPTPLDASNLAWHWMFAFTPADVHSVMVGGRWVMRNRELPGIDEEKVRREAGREAYNLWKRMEALA